MKAFLYCVSIVLIRSGATNDGHLWNLEIDPTESDNLYGNKNYQLIQSNLMSRLAHWKTQLLADDDTDTILNNEKVKAAAYKECGGVCKLL